MECTQLPGVGVKCPVEFGLVLIIKCCCGCKTLTFAVALFIVVADRPPAFCVWAKWWSRGGDTGSDFTLIGIGEVDGGGVLFDTAKWDKLLVNAQSNRLIYSSPSVLAWFDLDWSGGSCKYLVCWTVLMFWWLQFDKPITSDEFIEKSCAPNEFIDEYDDNPDKLGVCSETTGVLRDACCRCCLWINPVYLKCTCLAYPNKNTYLIVRHFIVWLKPSIHWSWYNDSQIWVAIGLSSWRLLSMAADIVWSYRNWEKLNFTFGSFQTTK